ncbi:uncharacterized protein [Typha latifolia]|uniref:uncharacterized protein n=1 Tax=Typha latifolia TaxID=4733 RepID=UPI003C2AF724
MEAPTSGSALSLNRLPDDVALTVVSYLEVCDVCSLGSCSKFWRYLCASNSIWAELYKRRWPALAVASGSLSNPAGNSLIQVVGGGRGECSAEAEASSLVPTEGWKAFYINKHRTLAAAVSSVVAYVNGCSQNESLEVGYYLKALGDLGLIKLGFRDVQFLLFSRRLNVLLNLIGLHYSIVCLGIPPNDVRRALLSCQVSERQVSISWFKLGRWFYGFRLPDEHHSRKVSLGELTMAEEEELLAVLNRGALHEVLRVQIAPVTPSTKWL